jgi:hypothetical protein
MADISPEERCHYASVHGGFIGQTAIWPALGGSRHRFRGAVDCPKLAWAMRLPEKQQAPLSSGAQEIVSLVAVSVVKTFRISGCT